MTSKKAFTLIELLVVVAIIAMLLAIIAPAKITARGKSKELLCKVNLRFIGLGMSEYFDDYDGKVFPTPPNGSEWLDTEGNFLSPNDYDARFNAYWGITYKDYVGTPKVFSCPNFKDPWVLLYNYGKTSEFTFCTAFALNDKLSSNFTRISEIKSPDSFIICHDHVEPKIENGSRDCFHNDGPGTMNLTQFRPFGGSRQNYYPYIFRHNKRYDDPDRTGGSANILWLDGHVSTLAETTGDDVPKSWYEGQ